MSTQPDSHWKPFQREIQAALSELLGDVPSWVIIRQANAELSETEAAELPSAQQEKWLRLRSGPTDPGRRLEWSEARRCEKSLRERLGEQACISIAHTCSESRIVAFAAGAALLTGPSGRNPGLGIDVERRSRVINAAVAERFTQPSEQNLGLDPLEIWVVKEALFKADACNKGTTISAHVISSFDPATRGGSGCIEGREARFALLSDPEWIVALAVSSA